MLSASYRIKRAYFKDIFKNSRLFFSKNLTLFVRKNPEIARNHSLFSFSASKKVSKIAPKRNKLRRQGYSIIRDLLPRIKPGLLCVFVYKPSAKEANFDDLRGQIENLLQKAGILTD